MKKQEQYTIAIMLIIFCLGGVLLPATGLIMFQGANMTTISISVMVLLALGVLALYQITKVSK
jgi:uncharacterized membrane protein